MECSSFSYQNAVPNSSLFPKTVENCTNRHNFLSRCSFPCTLGPAVLDNSPPCLSLSYPRSSFILHCCEKNDEPLSTSAAYDVLGIDSNCTPAQLKAAFRAKVKEFHPDVRQDKGTSDIMIRRIIRAYEMLSNYSRSEIIERECLDPFDEPECEAFDIFVNEVLCVGKACPYSCVKRAPQAFDFSSLTGTARARSQGSAYSKIPSSLQHNELTNSTYLLQNISHGKDYEVQAAVGQCPRSCIYYVTPSQRIILEELLDSIIDAPYDTSAEADLLYSLLVKAKYENNRYRKPKKQPMASTRHVDWY